MIWEIGESRAPQVMRMVSFCARQICRATLPVPSFCDFFFKPEQFSGFWFGAPAPSQRSLRRPGTSCLSLAIKISFEAERAKSRSVRWLRLSMPSRRARWFINLHRVRELPECIPLVRAYSLCAAQETRAACVIEDRANHARLFFSE